MEYKKHIIMGTLIKAMYNNWWFYTLTAIAIILLVASWFVPPTGAIDGSVLKAVGELFAFAALGTLIKAIDKGLDAKVTHGDTSVMVGNINTEEEETLCD